MQRRAARELIEPPMQSCNKFGTQYFLSLHSSNFIFSQKKFQKFSQFVSSGGLGISYDFNNDI